VATGESGNFSLMTSKDNLSGGGEGCLRCLPRVNRAKPKRGRKRKKTLKPCPKSRCRNRGEGVLLGTQLWEKAGTTLLSGKNGGAMGSEVVY